MSAQDAAQRSPGANRSDYFPVSGEMQFVPKIGASLETRFRVEPKHTINFGVANLPPVLATPWLIWFLEHGALQLMEPFLDPGEITVGTQVDIEHLAPALVGAEVVCSARVIHHEGPLYTFHIEAHDEQDLLAKGLHKRRVVETERLARRLEKKLS
jgi:fluoroacetyl-CoA thioesterase